MPDVLEKYNELQQILAQISAADRLLDQAEKIANEYGFAFYRRPFGTFRGDLTVAKAQEYQANTELFEAFDLDTREHIDDVIYNDSNHSQEDDYESWQTSFC